MIDSIWRVYILTIAYQWQLFAQYLFRHHQTVQINSNSCGNNIALYFIHFWWFAVGCWLWVFTPSVWNVTFSWHSWQWNIRVTGRSIVLFYYPIGHLFVHFVSIFHNCLSSSPLQWVIILGGVPFHLYRARVCLFIWERKRKGERGGRIGLLYGSLLFLL